MSPTARLFWGELRTVGAVLDASLIYGGLMLAALVGILWITRPLLGKRPLAVLYGAVVLVGALGLLWALLHSHAQAVRKARENAQTRPANTQPEQAR